MFKNLTLATPKKNTLLWLVLTALYSASILINEHYALIEALPISKGLISLIKAGGVFVYIFMTYLNFNQKVKDGTSPPSQ